MTSYQSIVALIGTSSIDAPVLTGVRNAIPMDRRIRALMNLVDGLPITSISEMGLFLLHFPVDPAIHRLDPSAGRTSRKIDISSAFPNINVSPYSAELFESMISINKLIRCLYTVTDSSVGNGSESHHGDIGSIPAVVLNFFLSNILNISIK